MEDKKYLSSLSFVIDGKPITKSNFSLTNKTTGKKFLPKNSPFRLYEEEIVDAVQRESNGQVFKGAIICVLIVYFQHKNKHPDLNNMTKSICDGIEKSGVIQNDINIKEIYLDEKYDYDNPRVDVFLYDKTLYKTEFKVVERCPDEIKQIQEESKSKPKTKRKSEKIAVLTCSSCNRETDVEHSRPIIGSKEVICNKCILLNF